MKKLLVLTVLALSFASFAAETVTSCDKINDSVLDVNTSRSAGEAVEDASGTDVNAG